MSIAVRLDARRRLAGAGFIAVLLLSVVWPSPVVSLNRLCCEADLAVDELSFLGRESPSWDVAYWCLAGLFAIALFQTGSYDWSDFREPLGVLRGARVRRSRAALGIAAGGAACVALIWIYADGRAIAWAEAIQSDAIEDVIRLANRLGGGMNPALVVGFFVIAGVVYRHTLWMRYGVAMAVAGLSAGILAQIVKLFVGRTRPELWLGPFHHARASASSFPSGHTVGAFALAGILIVGSRSVAVRATAFLVAAAVGLARVLAFRHWLSDVTASALIGFLAALLVWRGVTSVTGETEIRT